MAADVEFWRTSRGTTYQGTGHMIGVRQYFVRMAGCSHAQCPIRKECDEFPSFGKQAGTRTSVHETIDAALAEVGVGGWLHITGGEPTENPAFEELVRQSIAAGLKVHIQTGGMRAVEVPYDWLTVSPKVPLRNLAQRYGHELVVVYDSQSDDELLEFSRTTGFWYYYLSPLWVGAPRGHASNNTETAAAIDRLHERNSAEHRHHNGRQWMLGIQAHKYWGIY